MNQFRHKVSNKTKSKQGCYLTAQLLKYWNNIIVLKCCFIKMLKVVVCDILVPLKNLS